MDTGRAVRAAGLAVYLAVLGLLAGTVAAAAWVEVVAPSTVAGRQVAAAAGLGLGAALVTYFYLRYSGRDRSHLDVAVPDARGAGVAVGGFLAAVALSVGLQWGYDAVGVGTATHGAAEAATGGGPAVLAAGVLTSLVLGGPGEELLYRNVIQKHLYGAFGRPGAVVVVSAVFAVMHGPTYLTGPLGPGLASLSVVFAVSLVLGAAYVATENVTVPALIHGGYNAVTFAAVVLA
jgi:membrane protease YdiL (CAAX protease family)